MQEQTLLLVLVELAQEQYAEYPDEVVLDSCTQSELGRTLWRTLHKGARGASGETLSFSTTWYELSRRCGLQTGGPNQHQRQEQLKRLCEVTVWESQGGSNEKTRTRQAFLVAWLLGDDERVHLALNCRLASALLGQPYAQVSMTERLALSRDVAKAVHAFLSTTLRHGNMLKITVEKLMERLWPGDGRTVPAVTVRRRRKDVRDALNAIGTLDEWAINWERADLAEVKRNNVGAREKTISRINANKGSAYREQPASEIPKEIMELRSFDASGLFFNKAKSA